MDEIYTEQADEPIEETGDEQKKDRNPRPWSVYRKMSDQICCVAKHHPPGQTHQYGPATWQECWAYIQRSCQPTGAVYFC